MGFITADDALLLRLRGIMEEVEIRDPDGKLMGVYKPVISPEEEELYRRAIESIDPEEIDRIEEEGGPLHTFEQVWEHIREAEKRRR